MLDFEYTRPLPRPEMVGDRPEVAKLIDEIEGARERLDSAYKGLEAAGHRVVSAREDDTAALAASLRAGTKAPARQEEKRQAAVDEAKRQISAIEHMIVTLHHDLRTAVEKVRDQWKGELHDKVLPEARERLAEATETWVSSATALDASYSVSAWLHRFPQGKGYMPTRRPLLSLQGQNGEPIGVKVVEDAMRQLAEEPKPVAAEQVAVPLRVRGY